MISITPQCINLQTKIGFGMSGQVDHMCDELWSTTNGLLFMSFVLDAGDRTRPFVQEDARQ